MASAVTESALLAALSALLYMASWMPLLSQFVVLTCAMPITCAGARHGGGRAAMAALCAMIVIGLTGGPSEALIYAIPFGVMGAITGYFLHRDEEPGRLLLLGSGWLFVFIVPGTILLERALGLPDQVLELQKGAVWTVDLLARAVPFVSSTTTEWIAYHFRALTATFLLVPLAFFVSFAVVMFYANHLFSFLVLWRLRILVPPPADMRAFRTPRALLVIVPALALLWIAAGPESVSVSASLASNALGVALFVAYVGGFSVTTSLLDRSRLKPLARMGVSMLAMFVLFPATIALGLADAALDLRASRMPVDGKRLSGFR